MFVKLDLDSSVKMVILFSKKFLIRGLEIGEIIQFPVYMISLPFVKLDLDSLRKMVTILLKKLFGPRSRDRRNNSIFCL